MIIQVKDVLHSTNLIPSESHPISIYDEHVTMMQIKWVTNALMRRATMDAAEHEIDHTGEVPNEH